MPEKQTVHGGPTLLVDSSSLIYRAYYSTPTEVKAPDGRPMNAAYGFLGMLARLIADRDPKFIACAADADWRPEWRVELIESYKTHRVDPGGPQEEANDHIDAQVPVIFEILQLCGVAVVGKPGYEAEDVIGTIAQTAPAPVEIVSGDRDLFQLVRDPDVRVLYPKRGVSELVTVDEAYIQEKFKIPGRAYGDYAILRGDPSDGLPGVKGIGDKTAAALLTKYGSLEAVVEAALTDPATTALGKVKMALDYVDKAVKVVLIPTELELGDITLDRPRGEPDPSVFDLAEEHNLAGALRRLLLALR